MSGQPKKIAILGGGVGAMTAAFELTSTPERRAAYDVTVYQMGWRLGGKGASGRRMDDGARIEEHGLHVWSGFYDNAIKQMKDCLAELKDANEEAVYHSFEEAFIAHNNIVLGEDEQGGWSFWPLDVETNPATPGSDGVALSAWDYFLELSRYIRDLLAKGPGTLSQSRHPTAVLPKHVATHVAAQTNVDPEHPAAKVPELLHHLAHQLPRQPHKHSGKDLEALRTMTRALHTDVKTARAKAVGGGEALSADKERMQLVLDLGVTAMRGMITDEVALYGFDGIDDREISEWLTMHGARPETVNSPLVRAVYDYAFGFRNGITDPAHRGIGAGTFLHGSLRLFFTYKGSIFFKMRAGMGDTIFTPYYKALRNRGVKFKFFHKVRDLKLDGAGRLIDEIVVDQQATLKNADYDPFVRAANYDCWPSEPLYDQLEEGDALKSQKVRLESSWSDWAPVATHTLKRGTDFDEVVLGISLGALPHVAGDLIAADPAWRKMVERVETVATQAMQLWLKPTSEELGWDHGDRILTAYADAMNTWADMTHLDAAEEWPATDKPGSIAYFCGPLPDVDPLPPFTDTGFPARADADVRENALKWMNDHGPELWPNVFKQDGSGFDESKLISLQTPASGKMWDTQYFRANFEPTERYVLSVPGSTDARLRADRSGFDNLWLAGDWTYTGINAGCVEAAAMSGLRAAAGLTRSPVDIIGEVANPVPGHGHHGSAPDVPMAPVLKTIRPQNSAWPWSSVYGMAQTTGATVMVPFARQTVAAMLPKGLQLAPQTLTGPQEHPVILLFARQRDVRPNQLPFGMNYSEFICAVPWVQHTDPALQDLPPLIVPTRLYLDSLPPILLGIYGYGFPKVRAAMTVDMDTYVIRDPKTDEEIISCSFDRTGPQDAAYKFEMFNQARPGYEMAMVTRNRVGQWQYSVYDFSLGQSLLEPLDMQIRISSDHLGLPRGTIKPPSIAASPFGAVFLTSDATINNPLQSYHLRQVLREKAT
ncbi:NAD(P)-binding protein [Sulfitobacter sabulilitoris]|uniref:NAD(P)-binding protein n=1 Tax=Sulfitobacter sabulilitoris TaxID=2562655 RepID=UPI0014793ABA|nr:NAD(P)-binding protein [Sulfitobacter sabulilitoris]